jgi:hypothetical protein
MKNPMSGSLALKSVGSRKQQPATTRHQAIFGNVKRRRFLRPKVTIVQMAGKAIMKFTSPKPNEARSVFKVLYPASAKIFEE